MPGPDAGEGGKHLLLPPGWEGEVPDGYYAARSTTYRVIGGIRSCPSEATSKRRGTASPPSRSDRSTPPAGWVPPSWVDLSGKPMDTTPLEIETTVEYWRGLQRSFDTEPHLDAYQALYGELAALGMSRGRPSAGERP